MARFVSHHNLPPPRLTECLTLVCNISPLGLEIWQLRLEFQSLSNHALKYGPAPYTGRGGPRGDI